MLDSTLIKFVEPIGPGQIVDRDSLVALPIGYIQVSIENNKSELVVKILGIRGMYSNFSDGDLPPNTMIKTYIWQNGEVVSGEEVMEGPAENYVRASAKRASMRRRRFPCSSFRFRKDPTNYENEDTVIDGILQICAYKPTGPTNLQRKMFLGTVHISLKCLTSTSEPLMGSEEWYKVFPKSAFLPGSPSDIAKTNCFISGQSIVEEENEEILLDGDDVESTTSSCSSTTSPGSVVSFSQFGLQRARTPSIFTSPSTILRTPGAKTPRDPQQNLSRSRRVMKLLRRHKSVDENKLRCTASRRLPDPISASAPTSTSPFLVASPSSTSQLSFGRSFRYSSSTFSSSSDIGYESSRSECSGTSAEEDYNKNIKKSALRTTFEKALKRVGRGSVSESSPSNNIPAPITKRSLSNPASPDVSRGNFSKRFSRLKLSLSFPSLTEARRSSDNSTCNDAVRQ